MTPAARERLRVRVPMLFFCFAAWMLLLLEPGFVLFPIACAAGMQTMASPASPQMQVAISQPGLFAIGWVLMLAAMMAPLLIAPVRHVRDRSFSRRRARATGQFVAAYVAIWIAVGVILLRLVMAARLVTSGSSFLLAIAAVALVWEFSPIKQRCLNRCHSHPALAAFGLPADLDALRFGVTHGIWCAGSCWALMLLPLIVSRGHLALMAAITLWFAAERLETPIPPRWRWRCPSKAARIVAAQAQMWLQRS
jgi:predicted metal-binding membrane protein